MRLIRFSELTADELGAWEGLAARAAEPNPFFEPGFAAIAAKTLDAPEACLLVAEGEDGEWAGCMPVKPVPRRIGRLARGTWNHDYSFLGTPLVDRDHLDEYAEELIAAVEKRDTGRFLVLRDVHEGPVLAALRRAIGDSDKVTMTFERSIERAAVERRQKPGDYVSGLKSSRRRRLNGRRRKLEKAVDGELRFRDMRCEDGAVETFLELEAAGWKGEEGTAMACDPGSAEFFAQMCQWFDQRGRLHMRVMEGDDKTIVMICNVGAGNAVFSFKTAFDEEFRRYAPGLLLQLDDFEALHEREQDYMDSCGHPDASTLNELWPDRRTITTVVIGRRGLASRAARAVLQFHYSRIGRRLVAVFRRRSTRLGIAAGFVARHQQQALEIGEHPIPI